MVFTKGAMWISIKYFELATDDHPKVIKEVEKLFLKGENPREIKLEGLSWIILKMGRKRESPSNNEGDSLFYYFPKTNSAISSKIISLPRGKYPLLTASFLIINTWLFFTAFMFFQIVSSWNSFKRSEPSPVVNTNR